MKRNRRAGVEDRWTKTVRDAEGNSKTVPSANNGKRKPLARKVCRRAGGENTQGVRPARLDAQRWLDEVTAAVVTGQYVDPKAGQGQIPGRCGAVAEDAGAAPKLASACRDDVSPTRLPGAGRPLFCPRHAE